MNQPRATNQVSLYQRGHLVTSLPHVPIGACNRDEGIAVYLVDLFLEIARVESIFDTTNRK